MHKKEDLVKIDKKLFPVISSVSVLIVVVLYQNYREFTQGVLDLHERPEEKVDDYLKHDLYIDPEYSPNKSKLPLPLPFHTHFSYS